MPGFDLGENSVGRTPGMVLATPRSRLASVMQSSSGRADDVPGRDPEAKFTSRFGGVANPYGASLAAYEPNTLLMDGYEAAYNDVQASKRQEQFDDALASMSTHTADFTSEPIQSDGQVKKMVNAALDLARRGVPYVWGGITANGVDCSGLIVYAARAAGIPMQRMRAIDYGKLGQEVDPATARAGDIVYYDNPGTDTDHVGIYLGNGQVVQAPQSGDHVRVTSVGRFTSIRRIFADNLFGNVVTPGGGTSLAYNGSAWDPAATAPVTAGPATPISPLLPSTRPHGDFMRI